MQKLLLLGVFMSVTKTHEVMEEWQKAWFIYAMVSQGDPLPKDLKVTPADRENAQDVLWTKCFSDSAITKKQWQVLRSQKAPPGGYTSDDFREANKQAQSILREECAHELEVFRHRLLFSLHE
jgi:hypothetical protein